MNIEPWIEIKQGAAGDTVRALQHLLRAHGASIAADGVFGPATDAAVQAFQAAQGLPADGIVGPLTWGHAVVATSLGSTGEAVEGVQSFGLVTFPDEPPLAVDGTYGPTTESRVKTFQQVWGLARDGVAGRGTWAYLGADKRDVWPLVGPSATPGDPRVRSIQFLLRAHGYAIAADGVYGPETAEAVRQFAGSVRVRDVGSIVGNLDWPALIIQVSEGSSGDAVRAAQALIPKLPVDGAFGPITTAAIKQFQQMWGLQVDGVVGPVTWRTLVVPKFD